MDPYLFQAILRRDAEAHAALSRKQRKRRSPQNMLSREISAEYEMISAQYDHLSRHKYENKQYEKSILNMVKDNDAFSYTLEHFKNKYHIEQKELESVYKNTFEEVQKKIR